MYKRRKDIKNGMSKDKVINLIRVLKGFALGVDHIKNLKDFCTI